MSAFVDPDATRPVVVAPCPCPGKPHEHDEVTVRTEFTAAEIAAVGNAEGMKAVAREHVRVAVRGWTFVDRAGKPVRLNADTYASLRPSILALVVDAIGAGIEASTAPLPNGSGAPSRRSRRESASPTRARTRRRGT